MDNTFNSVEFINHLANQLIDNFDFAGRATTPVLVGSSRENEVRRKFEAIFPALVGVGSGCVIDTYGNTSAQIDILLFEKDICPKFSINNTPDSTYYPCEGVIAVGEIKSELGYKELEDGFKKIASVKNLKRYCIQKKSELVGTTVAFRKYGSVSSVIGTPDQAYDQENKLTDQIYGFILCGNIRMKPETLCRQMVELSSRYKDSELPNILVSLKQGVAVYLNIEDKKILDSKKGSTGIYFENQDSGNFQYLLYKLHSIANNGRTVEHIPLDRYILEKLQVKGSGAYYHFS